MATLLKSVQPSLSVYRDRKFEGSQEQYEDALRKSVCLYIGNLSFFTTEEQVWGLFSRIGEIKRIVMGLDQFQRTPCGFCFVIYYERRDAEDAVNYLNGTVLDERPIRVDFDWGYQEGRQYGRGRSGGQVRDEYRTSFDSGRGGYGKLVQAEIDALMQDGAIPQAQADDHDHRSEVGMRREREESSMDPSVMKPSKVAKASYDSGPSSLAQNPKFRGEGNEDE